MNRSHSGVYVGWILIVTALALIVKKLNLFAASGAGSNWWAFFLLIPAGGFLLKGLQRWREGARNRSLNLVRAALMILPVFAASLYPCLWKVIYIPYIALIGLDMIIRGVIAGKDARDGDRDDR